MLFSQVKLLINVFIAKDFDATNAKSIEEATHDVQSTFMAASSMS